MLTEEVILSWTTQFLLILIRVAAIFTQSPVFGRKNVPARVKILFSVMLSYVLINVFPPGNNFDFNLISYTMACLKELLVGLTIGFITTLFFSITYVAGQIIDISVGFSMVQLFDPQMGSQVTLSGSLLNLVMLLSFFILNGHHMLIRILTQTFTIMPPGNFQINFDIALIAVEVFVLTFILGVKIALPVVAAIFITEAALGLIIRSVPQMNMFVVGIPLKIVIGITSLALMIPLFHGLTGNIFEQMFNSIENIFLGMVAQ